MAVITVVGAMTAPHWLSFDASPVGSGFGASWGGCIRGRRGR
ncbi:hypothetical protein ACQP2F_12150 [Actinoplanes sp. CA-030573]